MCRACEQTFANASVDWVLPPWSGQDEVRDPLLQACFALTGLLGFRLALLCNVHAGLFSRVMLSGLCHAF